MDRAVALGVLLGADEVAVTAAAKALTGTTASAAPLIAVTEAFSWLYTAMAVGSAGGAAAAGILAARFGPAAAFALGGGACAVAALVTAGRSRTLTPAGQQLDCQTAAAAG